MFSMTTCFAAYKDDPTILAWETGNELYYPTLSWTLELARHIKQDIGAKQLVMDGKIISRLRDSIVPLNPL